MKITKKILFSSIICAAMALPVFSGSFKGKAAKEAKASSEPNYLCFTTEEAAAKVALNKNSVSAPAISLEFSLNATNWYDYSWTGTSGTEISLDDIGDKVYFRAKTTNSSLADCSGSSHLYHSFALSKKTKVSGDVTTLLNTNGGVTQLTNEGALAYLFKGCEKLTQAPDLVSTKLTKRCYYNTFASCKALTKAPALPATTLAEECYKYMFDNNHSLTDAPALPVTKLEKGCYYGMFRSCKALENAPVLPAVEMAVDCYGSMFQNCVKMKAAPALPATQLAARCYKELFSGCEALEAIPELPAKELAERCYNSMFSGCSALEDVYLPATTLVSDCYSYMFRESGIKSIELPAKTLAVGCYKNICADCTNLNTVKIGLTSANTTDMSSWLENVASNGKLYTINGLSITSGDDGKPDSWSQEDIYAVDVEESTGGYIKTNHGLALKDEVVTVTPVADENCSLKSLVYNDGENDVAITKTSEVYSFVMPETSVTIKAEFEHAPVAVSVNAKSNGTLSTSYSDNVEYGTAYLVDGAKLTIGDTEITAEPNDGFNFDCWKIGFNKVTEGGTITEGTTFDAYFKQKTLAEVLPEGFPSSIATAWVNENGAKMYMSSGALYVGDAAFYDIKGTDSVTYKSDAGVYEVTKGMSGHDVYVDFVINESTGIIESVNVTKNFTLADETPFGTYVKPLMDSETDLEVESANVTVALNEGVATLNISKDKYRGVVELYFDSALTEIPAGTYVFSDTEEEGTALISSGIVEKVPQNSYISLIDDSDNVTDCWLLNEGSVVVSYDELGKMIVDIEAKNTNGKDVMLSGVYATIKVQEILDTYELGFPTTPETAWKASNGCYCYLAEGQLSFRDAYSVNVQASTVAKADGDNYYVSSWGGWKVIFNMVDYKLVSISFEAVSGDATALIGTYAHVHALAETFNKVDATCETAGHEAYYKCNCGEYFSDAALTEEIADLTAWLAADGDGYIAASGHDFTGTVSYSWNEDHSKCTATVICSHDGCEETLTETAESEYIRDFEATCSANAKGHYEVTFKNELFEKQTTLMEDEPNTAKGHDYVITYTWNEDNTACVAKAECSKGDASITNEGTITVEEGYAVATFADEIFETQRVKLPEPEPEPQPTPEEPKGLSGGAIAGITVGSVAGVCLISYVAMFFVWKKNEKALKFLTPSFKWINTKIFKK